MKDREPTIRSRELGEGLRHAMEHVGFNGVQMAQHLDWSPAKVSRLLSGKRGGTGYDVTAFLAICGVKGKERDRLLALATDQDRPSWFQQHGPVLPKQVRTLMDHETKARTIEDFQTIVIPGLLQTSDYMRAITRCLPNVPEDEVEDRVSARHARQSLVSKSRPEFRFFIHEFALRTPVGSPSIMSEQLHYLLRMSVRPNLTLRVVSIEHGAHAAMSGPFTLMDIINFKKIVYLESATSCLFLETPVEIQAYRNILAALRNTALDEGQSRELITRIALKFKVDHGEVAEE